MEQVKQSNLGCETTRDRQIDYINETMGNNREGYLVYPELHEKRWDALKANLNELLNDICERIRDNNEDYFFESWKDKCYDHIIKTIDWGVLTQCTQCGKYYEWDDSDASYVEEFCSDDCEEVYEADRGRHGD